MDSLPSSLPSWIPPIPATENPIEILAYCGIVLLIDLPLIVFFFRRVFGGWRGWLRDKMYDATPNWVSLLRGEWRKDVAAEWRLQGFSLVVVLLLFGTHVAAGRWLVPAFERLVLPLLRR